MVAPHPQDGPIPSMPPTIPGAIPGRLAIEYAMYPASTGTIKANADLAPIWNSTPPSVWLAEASVT